MRLEQQALLLAALMLAFSVRTPAQVEKAAMSTTGISCGTCAVVSEVYLRRLPDIDQVTISRSKEAVMVSYKPGASFQPKDLRDALKKTDVGVVQFQISARGQVREQGGKRYFVAGKDKFILSAAANAPQIPSNIPVLVQGIVNDHANPMDLKVLTFKQLK
jgi:cation transport ATPase